MKIRILIIKYLFFTSETLFFDQILEATPPPQTTAVQPLSSHIIKHPSKTNT